MPMPKQEVCINKQNIPDDVEYFQSEEEVAMNKSGKGVNLYITCFNLPQQLLLLIDSMEKYNPELLRINNKYLIDNSTDETTKPAFDDIAKKYGFELIRKGNMGVCGARQWAAQHFHDGGSKYIIWFEDDMLMQDKNVLCKNGLNMHIDNWVDKCINIVEEEKLDFIKISFSEFFGDHHKQWAWHNVPQNVKNKYFSDGTHRMRWKNSGCIDGLSYLIGDVYYSNWPSVMTKAGNYKIFLETVYAAPFEQTIMSHAFQTMKKGRLRSAVLMASLVNHNRVHHYAKEIRKEC
jgi:glycosyltransferase involved in cell wall biosynthesis